MQQALFRNRADTSYAGVVWLTKAVPETACPMIENSPLSAPPTALSRSCPSSAEAETAAPSAAIIIIGNEILSGRTREANLATIAQRLGTIGVAVVEARVIPDHSQTIITHVQELRSRVRYLFTSGGIGPTHDDITAAAVAAAFGVGLVRDAEAERRLRRHYGAADLNAARLKMADVPEGATLIDNPVSAAPGFQIGNVYVLAGVPVVLEAMIDGLLPGLHGGPPILSRTLSCMLAEGVIATDLAVIAAAAAPAVEIGSYPYVRHGQLGVSLVVRGRDATSLEHATAAISAMITAHGGTAQIMDG